ncbi:DUF6444 domain-containing protein [Actinocrinis puniceicyclus]|uniref:DUF6444 domain-containing protein n=1 Tax=Actinocrinis puniceicyclus TaxID=977794 RepID=UPI003F6898FB
MPAESQPSYEELAAENAALREFVAGLEARILDLEARLKQNSKNSSRPPSSHPTPRQTRSVRRARLSTPAASAQTSVVHTTTAISTVVQATSAVRRFRTSLHSAANLQLTRAGDFGN